MKRKILACLLSLSLLILTLAPMADSFANEIEDVPAADSLVGEMEDVPAAVETDSRSVEGTQAASEEETPAPEPVSDPTPEPISESTPEVTPEQTPESTPDTTPGLTPEPSIASTPEPTPEPSIASTPDTTPESTSDPTASVEPDTTSDPTASVEPDTTSDPTASATPEPTPAPVIDAGGTVLVELESFVPGEHRIYESTGELHLSGSSGSVQDVVLPQSGKLELRASGSGSAQWQIYAPGVQLWVDIAGETSPTLTLTYAKIRSLLSGGSVRLRCAFTSGDSTVYSATARVSVRSDAEWDASQIEEGAAELPTLLSLAPAVYAADAPAQTCSVVINYVFENNAPVAEPYTAILATGSDFSATVPNPTILGYLPYVDGAVESSGSVQLEVTSIQADQTHTVVYKPTNVDYTVIHCLQNLGNDNYSEIARETKQGLTGSIVPEVAKAYEGFYALLYDRPAIAADGSTVVEVYYDRCYYLMRFDLGGGYGVEPVYARYGAPIDCGTPVRPGYSFDGWTLGGADASIPATMPAQNRSYAAKWTAAESSFTAVYWLQNADDDAYSVFGSATIDAITEETILPEDYSDFGEHIPIDANLQEVLPFMEFDHADGEVSVAGDRSTVVNLYYTRREFTLKFYYAMEDVDRGKYYIIGGSSYKFGASGASTDNSLDNLTNFYMDGGSAVVERGEVDEIPGLNATGRSRGYVTGSDSATKTVNGVSYRYRYHYLSFRARYGADISSLWPCDVLDSVTRLDKENTNGWSGVEAFFSAWNGEHHVWYSQKNRNQTIKGNYNRLDAQLLWDASQFGDYADASGTVDYLGFWENGANVNWNVPKLFRYRIWAPVLEGESTEGLTTTEREGVTYVLRSVYDTCDNSTVKEQTAPEIDGLTYMGNITPTSTPVQGVDYDVIEDFDPSLYKEAYEVNFYYARRHYTLAFYSAGEVVASKSLAFEQDISDQDFTPDYPAGYAQNAFEFGGWYASASFAAGTEVDFSGMRMPANDLLIYALWKPAAHTLCFYLNREKLELGEQLQGYPPRSVLHGSLAGEVAEPVNGAYVFVGWFYLDNGVEKAFDFDNMPVTGDLSVYGRWSSNTLKDYAVYYRALDDGAQVASPTLGSALAGVARTFEAKGGDALYPAYREGYFPTVRSHSITLDIESDAAESYTFWYAARDAVPYRVRYLNADTGESVAPDKVVSDNRSAVVTESFVPVSGMLPDAYQKRLVLRVDESGDSDDNVIVFYYSEDEVHAYYRIIHYIRSSDGITWVEHASSQAKGTIGQIYSASPMTIPGYSFDSSVAGTRTSGELTADGLELKLYYSCNAYPYEVRYLEEGTNVELAQSKTGSALYGSVVSESALDVEGYSLISPSPQTLTVRIESGTSAQLNIIRFYYRECEATISYVAVGPEGGATSPGSEVVKVHSGSATGSLPTAGAGYVFEGWFADSACTIPVDSDWVGADGRLIPRKPCHEMDGEWIPDPWTDVSYYAKFVPELTSLTIRKSISGAVEEDACFLFNLCGDGLDLDVLVVGSGYVTVEGLTVGKTCTVREISGNWRYELDSSARSVTLQSGGNSVIFNNTHDKERWLDDNAYAENVFSAVQEESGGER